MLFKDYLISIGVNPDVYLEMVKYRAKMFGYDDVIEISDRVDMKIKFYISENFKIAHKDVPWGKHKITPEFVHLVRFGKSYKHMKDTREGKAHYIGIDRDFKDHEDNFIEFEANDIFTEEILLYKKIYGNDCDILAINDIINKYMMANNCFEDIFKEHQRLCKTNIHGIYGDKALRLAYYGLFGPI